MQVENSPEKIIKGVKYFIERLPNVSYGVNAIQQSNIEEYGAGQAGFDLLKNELATFDFSKYYSLKDLDKEIKNRKKEITELEKKKAALSSVFGENGEPNQGSLAHDLLKSLQAEIEGFIKKRDDLKQQVDDAFEDAKVKLSEVEDRVNNAHLSANKIVNDALAEASRKVKIIDQFSDFLSETNKNMVLYRNVIIGLVLVIVVAIALSVPDLLNCFESYDNFITTLGTKASTWQIINLAFGLLIVKLPWALVISALFTGFYRLLKGLLITYEKINQDKRNMSAIYAVSGNIAQSLNEYGIEIAQEIEDPESGAIKYEIKSSPKDLLRKRESLKWNQIINYFERMQQHKEDPEKEMERAKEIADNNSKLESLISLLSKAVDKLPATK